MDDYDNLIFFPPVNPKSKKTTKRKKKNESEDFEIRLDMTKQQAENEEIIIFSPKKRKTDYLSSSDSGNIRFLK